MARTTCLWAGLAICFAAVLVYATFSSTTPGTPSREDYDAAARACQRAVRERFADARYLFAATVKDPGGDQLHVSGSMDSGDGMEVERRNYECSVRSHARTRAFIADSVEVWKSH